MGDWIAFSYIGEKFISIYVNKPASGSLTLTMYDNGEVISSITVDQNTPNDQIRFLQNMVYGLHNIVVRVTAVSEDFSGQVFSNSMIYCGAPSTVPYYPAWANSKHTVSFDSQGGSAVESQTVAENAAATEPTAPTLAGYRFLGWYLGEELYDFASPVVTDLKLVAKWEALTPYQVTFDPANGQATSEVTAYEGQPVAEPTAPTKDGHRFLGWFAEGSDTAYDFSAPISAALTLVAKWEEIPAADIYTVTFTGEGVDLPAQTVYKGDKAQKPTDPEREGYRFLGWFLGEAEEPFDFSTPITSDITLTARWIAKTGAKYTVTFCYYGTDGTWKETPVEVEEGQDATVPADVLPLHLTWEGDYTGVTADCTVTATYVRASWQQLPLRDKQNSNVYLDRLYARGETVTEAGQIQFNEVGDWIGFSYYGDNWISFTFSGTKITAGSLDLTLVCNGQVLYTYTVSAAHTDGNLQVKFAGGNGVDKLTLGLQNMVLYVSAVSADFEGSVQMSMCYYCGSSGADGTVNGTVPYAAKPTDLIYPAE